MEKVKEAIEETLEDVNEAIVEIANDVNDFAVEFSFSDLFDVGETLELAGTKLKEMKETKMEEMVEEVKPRLRRETFENSFLLSRAGVRQFLLVLLIIAQVMMQTEMLNQHC